MKSRSPNLSARISHLGARKLRFDEAIAELERAQRVFLESRYAVTQNGTRGRAERTVLEVILIDRDRKG
jgi:hypothetical protein